MRRNMRSRKQRKARKSDQDYIFPDNSLRAGEKALEYKEIAKNTNRLLNYEDLSDEQKLHVESLMGRLKKLIPQIDKRNEAKDLELEDDLVIMETKEQIPLKTFLWKLKNFVNGCVSLSPSMVALAETMDKVLEEGVTKNGDIVDAGKLGITANEVIECLKFAKSTSERIPTSFV
ncbi:hypothetical protein CAEBREN_09039 [Caenorhabditis brenneri]|uniref:Uncharacterized protein n=1 Tax=Caenorhabditis brenneri TaxID=135651 RepID=G0PBQ4_CAEBE|nr:hypothetical protein CAEBREN_09039 [Caenorhabditis brenneri]